MTEKETGTAKWFNGAKGHGFVSRDIGGDVFVHFSEIAGWGLRTLCEGERVDFKVEPGSKGLRATQVRALSRP